MKTLIKIAMCAILLSVTAFNSSNAATRPYKIYNDHGGLVVDKYSHFLKLKNQGRQLKILGNCDSACTIALFVHEDICIGKKAKFRFHSSFVKSRDSRGKEYDDVSVKVINQWLMLNYPDWVEEHINLYGGLSKKLITIDYNIAKKYLKTC
jgi:hypothetical protein